VDDVAIVLLAGGEARRFPGKLERDAGGAPLVVRCYRNVRATRWPVYIAGKGTFSRDLDERLDAPLIVDRRPGGGPLSAFLDACAIVPARRIAAVAADQPRIDAPLLHTLAASWRPGDEAVVPCHEGGIEPLAAIYDRAAVLYAAPRLRESGSSAMHQLVELLGVRFVSMNRRHFYNVNHPSDLSGAFAE
jgi:molybdopterin-guanine dinucleotide biosynthesis protein A